MLSRNFKETVKSFIANDEAYSFMNTIKGTPAYWKKFLLEVLAMVRQLGLPMFFMTLSCADLRWIELPMIMSKLNCMNKTDEEIKNKNYEERCNLLNKNPVLLARHFQYKVELFFKKIIIDGPLGKVKYHAIRVEFQIRGSPHVHSFLWVIDAPTLTKESKDEYILFVDHVIKATVPILSEDPELFNLVTTYQVHSHSLSEIQQCCLSLQFWKVVHFHTIVAEPIAPEYSKEEWEEILLKRDAILSKVKEYIDLNLDPKKVNILDPRKEGYIEPKSIQEILDELGLTQEKYYKVLSVSSDNDFQIHLRRLPSSCFVNNYFVHGLRAWEANLDIQPVFNHYKAVSYMCVPIFRNQKMNPLKQ